MRKERGAKHSPADGTDTVSSLCAHFTEGLRAVAASRFSKFAKHDFWGLYGMAGCEQKFLIREVCQQTGRFPFISLRFNNKRSPNPWRKLSEGRQDI